MARPKLGESETERLHIKITSDEMQAIDDWRYANRVPSRSEAVRRLVQIGLTTEAGIDQFPELARASYLGAVKNYNSMIKSWGSVLSGGRLARDQLSSLVRITWDQALDNLKAVEAVHVRLVTLYNAVEAIAGAKTLDEGIAGKDKAIIKGQEVIGSLAEKHAALQRLDDQNSDKQ